MEFDIFINHVLFLILSTAHFMIIAMNYLTVEICLISMITIYDCSIQLELREFDPGQEIYIMTLFLMHDMHNKVLIYLVNPKLRL